MTESQIAAIRARLNFEQESEFIEAFAPLISAGGMFLRTRQVKPVGSTIRFDFSLANGERLLFGEGLVRQVRQPTPQSPRAPSGMLIKFTKLNRSSKDLIRRVMLYKQQAQLAESEGEASTSGDGEWEQDDRTRAGMPLYDEEDTGLASLHDSGSRMSGDVRTSLANLQALRGRRREDSGVPGLTEELPRDATPVPNKYTAPQEELQLQEPAPEASAPNIPGVAPSAETRRPLFTPRAHEAEPPPVSSFDPLSAVLPPGTRVSEVAEAPAPQGDAPQADLGEFGLGMEEDEIDNVLGNLFGGDGGFGDFGDDMFGGGEEAPAAPAPLAAAPLPVDGDAEDALYMGLDESSDDAFPAHFPSSMPVPMAPPKPAPAPVFEEEPAEDPGPPGGLGSAVTDRFFEDDGADGELAADEDAPLALFGDPEALRVMARQLPAAQRSASMEALFPGMAPQSAAEEDFPISVADPVSEELPQPQPHVAAALENDMGFIDFGAEEDAEEESFVGFADEEPAQPEEANEVALSGDDEAMPFPGFADEDADEDAAQAPVADDSGDSGDAFFVDLDAPEASADADDRDAPGGDAQPGAEAAPFGAEEDDDDDFFVDLSLPEEAEHPGNEHAEIPEHLLVPASATPMHGVAGEEEAEVARLYDERDERDEAAAAQEVMTTAEGKALARIQLKRATAEDLAAAAAAAAAPEPEPLPEPPAVVAAPPAPTPEPERVRSAVFEVPEEDKGALGNLIGELQGDTSRASASNIPARDRIELTFRRAEERASPADPSLEELLSTARSELPADRDENSRGDDILDDVLGELPPPPNNSNPFAAPQGEPKKKKGILSRLFGRD